MRESSKRSSTITHHPVDLTADLPVVALPGRSRCQSSSASAITRMPGERRAEVVGHPRDELASGVLEPAARARVPRPAAGCAVGQVGGEPAGTPRGRGGPAATVLPPAPTRRTSSRSDCDHRTSAVDEHQRATTSETTAAALVTIEDDGAVVVGDQHPARDGLHADQDGEGADDADHGELPAQRPVAQEPPGPPGRPTRPTATPAGDRRRAQISVRSLMLGGLPPVADAPHREQPHRRWWGRARPSRAGAGRGRSPWTGRPNDQPHTCWSRSSRWRTRCRGRETRKASRSNSRVVSARLLARPCVTSTPGHGRRRGHRR